LRVSSPSGYQVPMGGLVSLLFSCPVFKVFWRLTMSRSDDDLGSTKSLSEAPTNLPKKPRRYFLPVLVGCIVLRLELFHRVSFDLQCSSPGVEVCSVLCSLDHASQASPESSIISLHAARHLTIFRCSCHWFFLSMNFSQGAEPGLNLKFRKTRTIWKSRTLIMFAA
jgi:hypothetical protein